MEEGLLASERIDILSSFKEKIPHALERKEEKGRFHFAREWMT